MYPIFRFSRRSECFSNGLHASGLRVLNASVGFYGTNIRKRECAPVAERAERGQRICDERVLFTVSYAF